MGAGEEQDHHFKGERQKAPSFQANLCVVLVVPVDAGARRCCLRPAPAQVRLQAARAHLHQLFPSCVGAAPREAEAGRTLIHHPDPLVALHYVLPESSRAVLEFYHDRH